MDQQIINVLNAFCDKFGIVVDWTSETIMPYMQELFSRCIKYEIATSIMCVVSFLLLTVISFVSVKYFHKKAMALEYQYDEDELVTWCAYASWICLVVFGIALITNLFIQAFDIATALTFPEKIIIKHIKPLIK